MVHAAKVPVIDAARLLDGTAPGAVAVEMDLACREHGFFLVENHGLSPALQRGLLEEARAFFALPMERKQQISMARGGRAWRGYFAVGDELTSGVPDGKEGVYFGVDLPPEDPRVQAGRPLHGPNLYPAERPELGALVREYMSAATSLGLALLRALALGLELPPGWIVDRWMREPTVLFRMFHYPPPDAQDPLPWGVGEHTDYGMLTVLLQDDVGGLEVKTREGWLAVPPVEGALVCNIGDMLERVTRGRYRSTPHRVRSSAGRDRYSLPLFLDPSWDARPQPIAALSATEEPAPARWDQGDVHAFEGTWGEYLLGKVARVFPALFAEVLR